MVWPYLLFAFAAGVALPVQFGINAQLAAWDRVIAEQSKEAFFKKVIDSQKAWVKRTQPYFSVASLTTYELAAAYKHFFG